MYTMKIVAVLFLSGLAKINCSLVGHALTAPAVVAPPVRYGLIAPQNIRPFAAQVSTFTKGLNIYAAPYAAGVLGGPAIIPKAVVPAPAVYPPVVLAPAYPSFAAAVAPASLAPLYPGVPHASLYPVPVAAPVIPAAPVAAHAHVPGIVGHSSLLPAPFGRSIHAVSPTLGHPLPAAPLIG